MEVDLIRVQEAIYIKHNNHRPKEWVLVWEWHKHREAILIQEEIWINSHNKCSNKIIISLHQSELGQCQNLFYQSNKSKVNYTEPQLQLFHIMLDLEQVHLNSNKLINNLLNKNLIIQITDKDKEALEVVGDTTDMLKWNENIKLGINV